jgi:hypothetical protein
VTQQHVVFASPTFTESFCSEYVKSFGLTVMLLERAGIKWDWIKRGGDPFVSHARNDLIADFLEIPTATDLFWIDDDVGWPPRRVMQFLASPEEIVAASPPKKTSQVDWPVDLCADPDTGELIENETGLIKAALIPFGFVRMKRSAVAKMVARSRPYREPTSDTAAREVHEVFQDGICDGRIYDDDGILTVRGSSDPGFFWGEDQVFCLKWHHLGGEIWLEPNVRFSHRGRGIWIASLAKNLDYFRDRVRELYGKKEPE